MPLQLVAHRGLPFQFPENSLIGFERAIQMGAHWLETDVRLTADGIPILYHDATADRMSGLPEPVRQLSLAKLQRYGAFQPSRFAARFRGNPVNTLRQFCQLLQQQPSTQALLELKWEPDAGNNQSLLIDNTLRIIEDTAVRNRVVVISFHADLLAAVRRALSLPIGLVCSWWKDQQRRALSALQPDFLLLKHDLYASLTAEQYTGSWRLGVFTVNDREAVRDFSTRGVELLETDRFDELWTPAEQRSLLERDGSGNSKRESQR